MIELTEKECCILINALNQLVIKENDVNDYSSIFGKLQRQLSLLDYLKEEDI